MGDCAVDPVRRLRRFVLWARWGGRAAAGLLLVILFGTWIQLSPAGTWAWPPSVLALLMTLVVVLGVPWAAFEAAWAIAECLRAQGAERPGPALSAAGARRLLQVLAEADEPGKTPARPMNDDVGEKLSDEALRGYFLGLHDREISSGEG